jgi:hypothetical protein
LGSSIRGGVFLAASALFKVGRRIRAGLKMFGLDLPSVDDGRLEAAALVDDRAYAEEMDGGGAAGMTVVLGMRVQGERQARSATT